MAVLKILTYGNDVLKQKAERIEDITDDIKHLASCMIETMHSAPGIGLAAPQVGKSIRLITVDLSVGEKEEELIVLINPEILDQDGEIISLEGCLSVPEINEKVSRPAWVKVKGCDLDGKDVILEGKETLARVLCHEIDHLNGKLFIDYLSPLKKNIIKKKFKKLKEPRQIP